MESLAPPSPAPLWFQVWRLVPLGLVQQVARLVQVQGAALLVLAVPAAAQPPDEPPGLLRTAAASVPL